MELIETCRNGRLEVVRRLLADERMDPAACDNYAIASASFNGYTDVVRLLLADERVDPAACDNRAILWASGHGHVEVVRLLLADDRVDPAACNNGAIASACLNGHVEVVWLLLADGRVNPHATEGVSAAYEEWVEHVRALAASLRGVLLRRTGLSEDVVAEVLFWVVPAREAGVVLSHYEGKE